MAKYWPKKKVIYSLKNRLNLVEIFTEETYRHKSLKRYGLYRDMVTIATRCYGINALSLYHSLPSKSLCNVMYFINKLY